MKSASHPTSIIYPAIYLSSKLQLTLWKSLMIYGVFVDSIRNLWIGYNENIIYKNLNFFYPSLGLIPQEDEQQAGLK